ncbi:MAG: tRNA (adenosine(37)-N6)-dimethylallyltransferase MiaA, partial [Candidatus Electrothrix sp. AR4]|nr:tRNA (adenosine(37)-N6)-dimethylallyltransferase MiaA [Candidatus Electrothrix sp. AR4]
FGVVFQAALSCDREELCHRIAQRSEIMLDQGLIQEVERLRAMGYSPKLPSMQAIGYKHVNNFLSGEWSQSEMLEYLIRDTRRYAKRQMTWFKKNKDLHWFSREEHDRIAEEAVKRFSV